MSTATIDAPTLPREPKEYGPCARCAQTIREPEHTARTGCGGTGYGTDGEGRKFCYPCCGLNDREDMERTGRGVLYLSMPPNPNNQNRPDTSRAKVTNWPGTATFQVLACWPIRHNMARSAYVCRFIGPDGFVWSGRNIGDSQILRARRTVERYLAGGVSPGTSER